MLPWSSYRQRSLTCEKREVAYRPYRPLTALLKEYLRSPHLSTEQENDVEGISWK